MFRYLVPTILIGAAITLFFMYTKPILSDISNIKNEVTSYNEALDNAKALENERDKLTKKYNAIDTDNLTKLEKLLPDNVDNIRLILEIEKLASPYAMILKDVKYDSTLANKQDSSAPAGTLSQAPTQAVVENKEYGEWVLEFSTEGTYTNFINFTKDIESNLRIVDISSVVFSSDTGGVVLNKPQMNDSYKYTFKIKTYWLKN